MSGELEVSINKNFRALDEVSEEMRIKVANLITAAVERKRHGSLPVDKWKAAIFERLLREVNEITDSIIRRLETAVDNQEPLVVQSVHRDPIMLLDVKCRFDKLGFYTNLVKLKRHRNVLTVHLKQ